MSEFRVMWVQHQLAKYVAVEDGKAASGTAEAPANDEVAAAFAKYNRNGDGLLDLDEIRVLLEDAKFQVDDQYVNGIADMFGQWDTDGSGGVELGEFRQLWAQLKLGDMLRAAAAG